LKRAWTEITAIAAATLALPGAIWAGESGTASLGLGLSSYMAPSGQSQSQVDPSFDLSLSGRLENDTAALSGSMVSRYYLTDDHPYAIEVPEVYGTLGLPNGFSLGRKLESWSRMDDEWQLGLWQPRYRWDYLHPIDVGLSGAFVEFTSGLLYVTAFGSPLFIPERGAPVIEDHGALTSASPWFIPPVRVASVQGVTTPVNYDLQVPALKDLLLHPGGAVQVKLGGPEGFWGSMGWALKPENQLALGVSGFYGLSTESIQGTIHPRVIDHSLLSVETGLNRKPWSLWGSVTYEHPMRDETPTDWTTQEYTDARIWAAGAALAIGAWAGATLSLLGVSGGNAPDGGGSISAAGSAGTVFEDRYPFSSAVKVGGYSAVPGPWKDRVSASSHVLVDLGRTGSTPGGGMIWSTEFTYADELRRGFAALVGADIFAARASSGDPLATDFISRNRSNHQVRAGVTYAF
jgi:hypothetical protein